MQFDSELFFSALGLALLLEALPYILFPEKMLAFLRQLGEGDAGGLRRTGLVGLGVGLAILALTLGR